MRSHHLASLLAFVAISNASPLPQETQVTSTASSLTITAVPVPVSASPYPAEPTTNEFLYMHFDEDSQHDKHARDKIHNAFAGDWAETMQKGYESLADMNDSTVHRWFPREVVTNDSARIDARRYVSDVWRQIFQPNQTAPAPKSVVAGFTSYKEDYGYEEYGRQGGCHSRTLAYFSEDKGPFHICEQGLDLIPKASDLQCSKLGNKVSNDMQTLTSVLVHEFHHFDEAISSAPNSVGLVGDLEYGPRDCFLQRNNQSSFRNADSYTWFAVNAYYNSKCGKSFGDPEATF